MWLAIALNNQKLVELSLMFEILRRKWQMRREKIRQYTAAKMANMISYLNHKWVNFLLSLTYYRLEELTLDRFIKCNVDETTKHIKRYRFTPKKAQNLAWDSINEQYRIAIDDKSYDSALHEAKQNFLLENKVIRASACINALSINYNDELVAQLKEMGFIIDNSTNEKYTRSFNRAVNQIKSLHVKLRQKQFEAEEESKKAGKFKLTHQYFVNMLLSLSKFTGYPLNKNTITVLEFCAIQKSYNEQSKKHVN